MKSNIEKSVGWGMKIITCRRFWNFLWSDRDLELHPLFHVLNPRRLTGRLWWIPNLKEAWRIEYEKSKKHYIIHHDNENINPA